jgi:hypothetical protein
VGEGGGGGVGWKSVNSKKIGILTVKFWYFNSKSLKSVLFSVFTTVAVTEIEWITTHDMPHEHPLLH